MQRRCFAKWHQDSDGNVYRDGTILQYGDEWQLLGSVILLNPGSAKPLDRKPVNALLSKHLEGFNDNDEYYAYSLDPLMRALIEIFTQKFPNGGVIRIYNLFNLKNPKSGSAIEVLKKIEKSSFLFTPMSEVDFKDAAVIVATGDGVHADPRLENQLRRYIKKAPKDNLYAIVRKDKNLFTIQRTKPNQDGLIESYHPSYTCFYGNVTRWGVI